MDSVSKDVVPPESDGGGRRDNSDFGASASFADIGAFTQGDAASRWALGRYLLGRALAVQVSRSLLALALALAAVAAGVYFAGLTVLTVLLAIVAVAVLGARALLGAVLRRTTMFALGPDADRQLRSLVGDTRKDVARELRRLGLPSSSFTMPLLAFRLAGRRRRQVLARLREFDVARVVPGNRLDDLHLLLRAQASRGGSSR